MESLSKPSPPNLPRPSAQYSNDYQASLNNTLRLFFNQLSNALGGLLGERGGQYINNPCGAFQNDTSITLASANTATLIPITTTNYANGMFHDPGDGIHVTTSGLYNYQFSIQFANTKNQIQTAVVWLRKNGADLSGTASKFDIIARRGGSDGYVIGACNFYVDLLAGEHVELWWACDSTNVYLDAAPAQTTPYPHPSIPSVVATLTFVSSYQGTP